MPTRVSKVAKQSIKVDGETVGAETALGGQAQQAQHHRTSGGENPPAVHASKIHHQGHHQQVSHSHTDIALQDNQQQKPTGNSGEGGKPTAPAPAVSPADLRS